MDKLINLLKKYEKWEAKLILCDQCWKDAYPILNKELFDELMSIQKERNKILKLYEKQST